MTKATKFDEAAQRHEALRLAWREIVAPRRRSKKAPVVPVGFTYVKAINRLIGMKPGGYREKQIARLMGVSDGQVRKYRTGESIPDHIGGESLWALYDEVFGRCAALHDLVPPECFLHWDSKTYLGSGKGRNA